MKRGAYGYGSYRGRGRGSTGLKILAGILAVVLLLGVVGFFLAERYMVYDDSGRARLELPFLSGKAPKPSETPSADPTLPAVVTQTPEVPDRPEELQVVTLEPSALWDGTAADAVAEGGGNAALFEMKGPDGVLAWVSDQELAIAAKVSAAEPGLNEKIREAARTEGVYRVAQISCFKDHELSNADSTLAIYTASGYRWLDVDGNRWLSPADESVQTYLAALCLELAELGFDEILLEHAGYPTQGRLEYIRQDEAAAAGKRDEVITGFYQRVSQTLEGTGTGLSVVYEAETAALSGQSPEEIKALGIGIVIRDEAGVLTWQN